MTAPRWVGWWFRGAALYGAAVLLALFVTPSPADPLFHYGFAGTALAFQAAFWVIGGDPVRHRPLMIPALLEKAAFVGPVTALGLAHRLGGGALAAGAIDLILAIGFVMARRATPA